MAGSFFARLTICYLEFCLVITQITLPNLKFRLHPFILPPYCCGYTGVRVAGGYTDFSVAWGWADVRVTGGIPMSGWLGVYSCQVGWGVRSCHSGGSGVFWCQGGWGYNVGWLVPGGNTDVRVDWGYTDDFLLMSRWLDEWVRIIVIYRWRWGEGRHSGLWPSC